MSERTRKMLAAGKLERRTRPTPADIAWYMAARARAGRLGWTTTARLLDKAADGGDWDRVFELARFSYDNGDGS